MHKEMRQSPQIVLTFRKHELILISVINEQGEFTNMTKGTTNGKSTVAHTKQESRNPRPGHGQLENQSANAASPTRIRVRAESARGPEGKPGDNFNDLIAGRKSAATETVPEIRTADAQPAERRLTPLASYEHGYNSGYAVGEQDQRELRRRQAEEQQGTTLHSLGFWQGCSLFLAGTMVGMLFAILT